MILGQLCWTKCRGEPECAARGERTLATSLCSAGQNVGASQNARPEAGARWPQACAQIRHLEINAARSERESRTEQRPEANCSGGVINNNKPVRKYDTWKSTRPEASVNRALSSGQRRTAVAV